MNVSIIAALGRNREIGSENKLLWHLPEDLKRFRELTQGHAVIMGRKTYESIGRPLPDRKNIIITRNSEYSAPGCVIASSMEEALEIATGDNEIFVIGGAEIYKLGLPQANRMYLTFVDADLQADTFFPEFDEASWKVVSEETREKDDKNPYRYTFKTLSRR